MNIQNKIYLAQTDTTVGFLSKDLASLNLIKGRDINQPCIITTAKFSELKGLARVPSTFKNLVRKAKKTTFIYPKLRAYAKELSKKNEAFSSLSIRVVKGCKHADFLEKNGWFYSSSANLHGKNYDENWAKSVADIVLDDKLFQNEASKIIKLSRINLRKMR